MQDSISDEKFTQSINKLLLKIFNEYNLDLNLYNELEKKDNIIKFMNISYILGLHNYKNKEIYYHESAAKLGHPESIMFLAKYYFDKKDFKRVINYYSIYIKNKSNYNISYYKESITNIIESYDNIIKTDKEIDESVYYAKLGTQLKITNCIIYLSKY